ncbi:MAG: hypothetical protein AAB649_07085 [Patescibacteria group bacterium]
MKHIYTVCLGLLLTLIIPVSILASIGVGVSTGKIVVNDKLKPGIIYQLPSLTVINTGTQESYYEVSIQYHEKQPQLMPSRGWFIFTPHSFRLKPKQIQVVDIKLNLPVQVEPGKYFAYLEAHPTKKVKNGSTSVGVAAAAKLYFEIIPANIMQGIYYKLISFWNVYAPWPQRAAIAVGIIVVLLVFKKFFNIEINLKKTPVNKENKHE